MENNILYIGLNGFAGSGKDTVAKMMMCILNNNFTDIEDAWKEYKENYSHKNKQYATLNDNLSTKYKCICIAFADNLKKLCSTLFGIPVSYFYYNKSNAWICINKNFEYTEVKPSISNIVTAEEYYQNKEKYIYNSENFYMSLREILVYVGTYICQYNINKNTFVNSVSNLTEYYIDSSSNLSYIICTDVRFFHEFDFIKNHNGIMINIVKNDVKQQEDIAEHELDMISNEEYNFIIENNSTYRILFENVWNMIKENKIFLNKTKNLKTRDHSINNYIRLLSSKNNENNYMLCNEDTIASISYNNGVIESIMPVGGPNISIGDNIDNEVVIKINFDEFLDYYIITTKI